jgi:hypothetical protein
MVIQRLIMAENAFIHTMSGTNPNPKQPIAIFGEIDA